MTAACLIIAAVAHTDLKDNGDGSNAWHVYYDGTMIYGSKFYFNHFWPVRSAK